MALQLLLVLLAFASPIVSLIPSCQDPIVRKEWRSLSPSDQMSYLDAVDCILNKPSLTPPFNGSGVKSRYDDLLYTHIQQTFSIHYVGHFLPWHRYFVATYEHMLRTECGYDGAQPYWDWTLDVGSDEAFVNSPVFSAELGFGGNGPYVEGSSSDPFAVPGRTGGGCVSDGPFSGKDDIVHLGPASSVVYNPQCLKRDLSPSFARRYLGMNQTVLTLNQTDYGWFDRVVEGGPSFDASGIHGGQMGDLYASPADSIFYLHHANLDRVWWSWQSYDLESRLQDISGPIFLMDYDNVQGGNVTLDFDMTVGVSAPNVTVGDVMDIKSGASDGIVCYTYDELYVL
ncbi:Tyrosinase [Diaporthe amygdali]|uniref:Tyrosinase n=1 Tax=Phomopsis amygdali TaxID=1214568 RepID=UPI0022FE3CAA|nr:Tyrosinase [Diaporthe amygdali]KAJ0123969.1 Tyrosinase [Diaporthe amygdali]